MLTWADGRYSSTVSSLSPQGLYHELIVPGACHESRMGQQPTSTSHRSVQPGEYFYWIRAHVTNTHRSQTHLAACSRCADLTRSTDSTKSKRFFVACSRACGCVSVWACEIVSVQVCERVWARERASVWVCEQGERVSVWVCECVSARVCECVRVWECESVRVGK